MNPNAAGLIVAGFANPNWKGGEIRKDCVICGDGFTVKPGRKAAQFCSMKCVGVSQRGRSRPARARVLKQCAICAAQFTIYRSHQHRSECCSRQCSGLLRAERQSGDGNPNWRGGLSRMPYPWNFRAVSRSIIERDAGTCRNPGCSGIDQRMTAHHIDYDKGNCDGRNLIALCSACNSRANFGRPRWQKFYAEIMSRRGEA